MAHIGTVKIKKNCWVCVASVSCLIQFKLDLSTRCYWWEGDTSPVELINSPDEREDIGILNDGNGRGDSFLDKRYTNTIGKLWVYSPDVMYATLLEVV